MDNSTIKESYRKNKIVKTCVLLSHARKIFLYIDFFDTKINSYATNIILCISIQV